MYRSPDVISEVQEPSDRKEQALQKLRSWINKVMRIEMTDGRVLVGRFICTDNDGNTIIGSCHEYLNPEGVREPGIFLHLHKMKLSPGTSSQKIKPCTKRLPCSELKNPAAKFVGSLMTRGYWV